jgi:hypothetical protein
MTFYSPTDSKFPRLYQEEVQIVFSAIDCVLNGEKAIYCSSELTTGLKLYEAMKNNGVTSRAGLEEKLGKEWVKLNIFAVNEKSANDFAQSVRHALSDKTMVITPAPFSAPGWSQSEYLAFWETLIRTRVKAAWFNRDWQFSNGCTFEFAVAQDAGIPTFTRDGNALDRQMGIAAMRSAIEQLSKEGFDTSKLRESFERVGVPQLSPS